MVAAHGYPAYRCFKAMQRRRPDLHELLFFCQFWSVLSPRLPLVLTPLLPRVLSPRLPLVLPPRLPLVLSSRLSLAPSVPSVLSTPACTILPQILVRPPLFFTVTV
ncbi:unnamed protein product [Closterium sp. NIES-54]